MTRQRRQSGCCWGRTPCLSRIEWSPGSLCRSSHLDSRSKDSPKPSSVSPATGSRSFLNVLNFWRAYCILVGFLIVLFWTSGDVCPGFRSQVGSLIFMLSYLCAMDSSDSRVLTSLQPILFDPHTCRSCVHKHRWGSNPRPTDRKFKKKTYRSIRCPICDCDTFFLTSGCIGPSDVVTVAKYKHFH